MYLIIFGEEEFKHHNSLNISFPGDYNKQCKRDSSLKGQCNKIGPVQPLGYIQTDIRKSKQVN